MPESTSLAAFVLGATWICLSAGIVLLNKYILSLTSFKYVFLLAFAHMTSSAILCRVVFAIAPRICTRQDVSPSSNLSSSILAIASLLSISLISSNAALLRLDVATVQMIKAVNPALIYVFGVLHGIEKAGWPIVGAIAVICGGVVFSVYDAARFHPIGVLFQIVSITCDSGRYICLQSLLQASGAKLDAINVLHMIAPVAAAFLWTAASIWEIPAVRFDEQNWRMIVPLLCASSMLAFALNMCSYAYIKATSALTMSVSGIIKDVFMIALSFILFGSHVTWQQCVGFGIAIYGTALYTTLRNKHADDDSPRADESKAGQAATDSE